MNRTDRLYALVEELRAVAPRPRSARVLAARFDVSVRTVERDVSALQQAGVPIYAEPGRIGGYVLDRQRTLPPLNVTAAEAAALTVALDRVADTPFSRAARSAVLKVRAGMGADDRAAADVLVGRVKLLPSADMHPRPAVPAVIEEALETRRVLWLDYEDRHAEVSRRAVEPVAFVGAERHWYLLAWCRMRDDARCFRLDRIRRAVATDERAQVRDLDTVMADLPVVLRVPSFA